MNRNITRTAEEILSFLNVPIENEASRDKYTLKLKSCLRGLLDSQSRGIYTNFSDDEIAQLVSKRLNMRLLSFEQLQKLCGKEPSKTAKKYRLELNFSTPRLLKIFKCWFLDSGKQSYNQSCINSDPPIDTFIEHGRTRINFFVGDDDESETQEETDNVNSVTTN
jgi:hypothetical protein